jgi:hypothetical protein
VTLLRRLWKEDEADRGCPARDVAAQKVGQLQRVLVFKDKKHVVVMRAQVGVPHLWLTVLVVPRPLESAGLR